MATMELTPMSSTPVFPPTEPNGQDVARACLHLKWNFEKFGNSRKVNSTAIEKFQGETDEKKTDRNLVTVNTKLLKSPELKSITDADSELKKRVELLCLPFEKGFRLVPKPAVEEVTQLLRTHTVKRRLLVDAFLACYEIEVERAKLALGPLFNPKNYPSVEAMREEFSFSYRYVSFGTPGDLKDINPQIFEEEREKAALQLQSAAEEIQAVMRQTLAELIERLKVSLTPTEDGKRRKLYDTAVTNLQDFLGTFNLRNVTNDRELAALVDQAKAVMQGVNTEKLKDGETLRLAVKTGMEEVSKLIQPLVSTKVRKIRFEKDVQ